jgi:hypothetical protein
VNAIVVNDLAVELTDDTLNQLAIEDALSKEMGQLSLNAIAETEIGESMRIRALVQNKIMFILVDSGSSHSFINQSFVSRVEVHTTPITPLQVKVANGETRISYKQVHKLWWWAQGYNFHTDMRVLDLEAYDAIPRYDCLKTHSPMVCL